MHNKNKYGKQCDISFSLPDSGGGGCFPSTARVELQNGKMVKMFELQIDDQVKTGTLHKHECILTLFTYYLNYFK